MRNKEDDIWKAEEQLNSLKRGTNIETIKADLNAWISNLNEQKETEVKLLEGL